MFKTIQKSLIAIAVVGLMTTSTTFATDQVSHKLLTEFWSTTKGKETTRFFANQESRTPQAVYAFALVKAQQHDVAMALRATEVLATKDPTNPKPLRLKVWLELRQNKFEPALTSLAKFITLIEQDKDTTRFQKTQAYEFAGRIFGFLDGPVADKVDMGTRDETINQILDGLNEDMHQSFESGYSTVATKFKGMMSEKMRVDMDAAKQDAIIQKAKYNSLAEKEKQLHEAEQRTAAERRQTRNSINQGLTDIARKDLTYSNLQNRYRPYYGRPYRQILIHGSGSSSSSSKAKHHHVVGFTVRRPILFGSHYNDLTARRNVLAGHYNELRNAGAGQMNSLNKELKEISKAKNRTMNQKLRALKPSGKMVTQSVALKSKAKSIMTYEKFPLEIERQLLLAATK